MTATQKPTWRDEPATDAQRRALKRDWVDGMSKGEASEAIEARIARAKKRDRQEQELRDIGDYDDEELLWAVGREWGDL